MSDAFANAATTGSLDAADIYRMDKSLKTLTLADTTLVKDVASIRSELATDSSSHWSNSNLNNRFSKICYYWSHGYKVAKKHTSQFCTKIKYCHKEKSTRRYTMGGNDYNKG